MSVRDIRYGAWTTSPGGISIPEGRQTEKYTTGSDSYLSTKEKGQEIERIYAGAGVRLHPDSGLAKLIAGAKETSDSWLLERTHGAPTKALWQSVHLARIADAVISVANDPEKLEKLTQGSLDPFDREESEAKNHLWEYELLGFFNRNGVHTRFEDPPDLICELDGVEVAVACKKLYSEKNVEKVVSNAVSQIEASARHGIVAFSLDELMPKDTVYGAPTQSSAADGLDEINMAFLRRHERHFLKYFGGDRILCVLVNTAVIADLRHEKQRLNNFRQAGIWRVPDVSPESQGVFDAIYRLMAR